ncbi:MAG: hypothetical protein PHI73_03720 [Patescibacteria group bacterium]|nr:hypothetical protein [Patescibacteria group bacterium]
MLLGFSLMSFFVGLLMTPITEASKMIFARAAFFSGTASFVSLLELAIYYPLPTLMSQLVRRLLIFGSIFIVLPIIISHPSFIDAVVVHGGFVGIEPGNAFWALFTVSSIYFFLSLYLLLKKIKIVTPQQKKQVAFVTIIIGISGIIGLVIDRILPLINLSFNMAYSPIFAGVVAVMIAGVALKK